MNTLLQPKQIKQTILNEQVRPRCSQSQPSGGQLEMQRHHPTPPGTPCAMRPPQCVTTPCKEKAAKNAGGCRARHACTGARSQVQQHGDAAAYFMHVSNYHSHLNGNIRYEWRPLSKCLLWLCCGQSCCLHLQQWHMPCHQYWNPQPRRASITPAVCPEPAMSIQAASPGGQSTLSHTPPCSLHTLHHCLSTSTSPARTAPRSR